MARYDVNNIAVSSLLCRVHHIETLFLGIKCNFYREFSVISTHDLLSNNRSSQSGDALLPINQDFFAGGYGSILQFYIRVLPNDDVSVQAMRDEKKNHILSQYGIPLLRLKTDGHTQRFACAFAEKHIAAERNLDKEGQKWNKRRFLQPHSCCTRYSGPSPHSLSGHFVDLGR